MNYLSHLDSVTEEALIPLLIQAEDGHLLDCPGGLVSAPYGNLVVCKDWCGESRYNIEFPQNPNTNVVNTRSKNRERRLETVATFIDSEHEHLSWKDGRKTPGPFCDEIDTHPLDNACVELGKLLDRQESTALLRREVFESVASAMFDEVVRYSKLLDLNFSGMNVYQFQNNHMMPGIVPSGTAANYCGGHINYNAAYLSKDPNVIRETLVHELCHDKVFSHGPKFVHLMEDSLVKIGFCTNGASMRRIIIGTDPGLFFRSS